MTDIQPYDRCSVIDVLGAGRHNLGIDRRFILPFEIVDTLHESRRARVVRSRAWRRRLKAAAVEAGPAGGLRTARTAKIELLRHQLEPALAVLRGRCSRVLLADEVGLGKTIQAGLIVSELVHCGAAARVLILTPAGLRDQWKDELGDRFDLHAAVLDVREVRRLVASLPVGNNPWAAVSIGISSIDYIKRMEVLAAVEACRWDVVVVDEAHGVVAGTERFRAVSALAGRAHYVVLLTATPHNGDGEAFRCLCGLGAAANASGAADPVLVFRRTRAEVALGSARHIHRLTVRSSPEERRMHTLLEAFARTVRAEGGESHPVWLALTVLLKRAFSSARALEISLRRRLDVLGTPPERMSQLALPLDDPEGELEAADDCPTWRGPVLKDENRERALLVELAGAAAAAARGETKIRRVSRLLDTLAPRGERAIVFTEYRDTLLWLRDRLHRPSAVLHGGLTRQERQAALLNFSTGSARLLLATDAGGEGLNLHHECRVVINLELPWSPTRLEQRIGRVDRIGQRRIVHAFHMIAGETGEAVIGDRLRTRIAALRAEVGGADPLGGAPAADDTITARSVIFGTVVEPSRPAEPPSARGVPGAWSVARPTREAALERARLVWTRSLDATRASTPPAAGSLVAIARSRRARTLLGTRCLVVLQSVLEDACGRPLATHVTPLLVVPTGHLSRQTMLARVHDLIHDVEARAVGLVRADRERWLADSVHLHSSFWSARLRRERATAMRMADPADPRFQPGLFDRRAERLRSALDAHDQVAADRIRLEAIVLRTAEVRVTPARAILLLVP